MDQVRANQRLFFWLLNETHHCRDVQLVVLKVGSIFHLQSDFGQSHRSTEVEEGGDTVIHKVLEEEEEI